LIGVADIPAHSVDGAVDELRSIGKGGLGLRGALFDWFNAPKSVWHPMWEPLWSAAEEADVAISFHIGAGHGTTTVGPSGVDEKLSGTYQSINVSASSRGGHAGRRVLSIILCGALERHPNLKIVGEVTSAGFYLLDRLDASTKSIRT
jgi:predicted TIM-barrel fold metal-dependent hydrolase